MGVEMGRTIDWIEEKLGAWVGGGVGLGFDV